MTRTAVETFAHTLLIATPKGLLPVDATVTVRFNPSDMGCLYGAPESCYEAEAAELLSLSVELYGGTLDAAELAALVDDMEALELEVLARAETLADAREAAILH